MTLCWSVLCVPHGTPVTSYCDMQVFFCFAFFFFKKKKTLSYFINKRYFVISKWCPYCPKAAWSSYSSAAGTADSGCWPNELGLPPRASSPLLPEMWLAGPPKTLPFLPTFVHEASLLIITSQWVRVAGGA